MPPALRVNVTSKFQGVDSSRLHYQTHQIPLIRMDSSLIIEFTPGRANYYAIFLYFLPMADLELNSVFINIRKYKRHFETLVQNVVLGALILDVYV